MHIIIVVGLIDLLATDIKHPEPVLYPDPELENKGYLNYEQIELDWEEGQSEVKVTTL